VRCSGNAVARVCAATPTRRIRQWVWSVDRLAGASTQPRLAGGWGWVASRSYMSSVYGATRKGFHQITYIYPSGREAQQRRR
jgi:hypothetical protein